MSLYLPAPVYPILLEPLSCCLRYENSILPTHNVIVIVVGGGEGG